MMISVCVPVHNDASRIADTVRQLASALENLHYYSGFDYEVVFADGASTDGSVEMLLNVANYESMRNVKVVPNKEYRGKGQLMRRAVGASAGDIVICVDSDLAFGTDVFGEAIDEIMSGADAVIGSRRMIRGKLLGYTLPRRIISFMYNTFVRLIGGCRFTDISCAFRAYSGKAARRIYPLTRIDGYAIRYESAMIADKMGCRIVELPIHVMGTTGIDRDMLKCGSKACADVVKTARRLKKMRFVKRRTESAAKR